MSDRPAAKLDTVLVAKLTIMLAHLSMLQNGVLAALVRDDRDRALEEYNAANGKLLEIVNLIEKWEKDLESYSGA